MATKQDLKAWVLEALQAKSPATVTEIARHIWEHHEDDLKASGDLLYTWQYDMRWAGQSLQNGGFIAKKGPKRSWQLVEISSAFCSPIWR
jgi:hypothetical protein